MNKKPKNIFVQGRIDASFIADSIQKHSTQTEIGAHSIFLGQVRSEVKDEKSVAEVDYTADEAASLEQMHLVREAIFAKYPLTCMHIYHSLGRVKAGEIFLFVFTSSRHHKDAIASCEEVVARIKKELPVKSKEIMED
ncbi:MAG: molybdenum cofactor biosynthesis protein MoaE [Williamsia sp.]|nr:molybdenum cofactor biosynthesis protein MoaE [Williamsia sp.]